MENLLNKYRPAQLSEMLGDKTQIQRIDKFIKQFTKKNIDINKIPNPNLIISGTNGIGKTLVADLVLKENYLEKITADLSSISVERKTKRKKKVEKEMPGSNRTVKTYYMSLQNHKNMLETGEYICNKIALVFDDVSNISNPKEKEAIKSLVKLNNKLKRFPIIIIANTNHSKIVNELRKMVTYKINKKTNSSKRESRKIVNEIVLKAPSFNELEEFIKKICKNEGIRIVSKKSDDDDIYCELVEHAQNDIRRLINILEELGMIYEGSDITMDMFEDYKEISKKKDLNPGIFEATRTLLNKYSDIESALLLYGEERATIPLMVHENYPSNIKQQYPKMPIDVQMDMIFDISKSISESDKVDGLIYSNQCWSLQPVHGFYSCALPSYYINKYPKKLCKVETYQYTQDYNKTSIKKINNKVIKKAQENQFLKKVSIYDFLYIASILKTLFEKKEFDKVVELMKPYGLTLKEIESIIKIDKIKMDKLKKSNNMLTGKQKTLMREMLGVDE